jgi:YidC/Oxa1 family membrane protein insertase
MENQRSLLYIALAFTGFLLYQAWVTDHAPVPPPQAEDTNTAAKTEEATLPTSGDDIPQAGEGAAPPVEVPTAEKKDIAPTIKVVTDVLEVEISTQGGDIVSVNLPTYPVSLEKKDTPFQLLHREPSTYIAQSGLLHEKQTDIDHLKRAPNHYAKFAAAQSEYKLEEGAEELKVPLAWETPEGIFVGKVFTFKRGKFLVDLDYQIENKSSSPWVGRQYNQIRHSAIDSDGGSMRMGARSFNGAAYYTEKYNKLAFSDMAEEPLKQEVTGGWVSMMEHYFLSAWLPNDPLSKNRLTSKVLSSNGAEEYLISMRSSPITIQAGESGELSSRFYAGPKLQNDLEKLAPGLELTVDYGILTIISKPLFWLLSTIHSAIGNWGWSIILLTILIKAVFFKLSAASYRSMAKMKSAAPKLKSLKERYGDDKQAYQKAMMDMYKKEKINPLGGCLPILIQIPVFISLYWVLLEAVELRQAPWMFWIKDLALKDPFFVLPLMMGITMFAQQKLNPPQPDPMMQKMLTMMPIVFTVFFAFFPAGLVLYWFVNNLLSIGQQWAITKGIEKEAKKI